MEQHKQIVEAVAASVSGFYDKGQPFRIHHGSTNSTRNQGFRDEQNKVNTSQLKDVLSIDTKTLTALVEPNVSMDRLVEATLEYNLIPQVVMDFPGITCGGGFAGTSGESSSFRHGFFDQTVEYVEMILANGNVVTCSAKEKADLFHGAAGALGTLGVVTMLCLRLEKASRFVEVTYHSVTSVSEAVEKCRSMSSRDSIDYLDGILFSTKSGAIITGRHVDENDPNMPIRTFSASKDPWFYMHVQESVSRQKEPVTELIPLAEYLFRYDRGGFWVGKTTFDYFLGLLPFTKTTRRWLDDWMHTRMLYAAMHAQLFNVMIIQDLALPYRNAEEFIDWTAKEVRIFPLWLCPLRQSASPTMHPHSMEHEPDGKTLQPLLNVGLWGFSRAGWPYDNWVKLNHSIEAKLRELAGMKWLYGANLQTEDEFWSQFDRRWYDDLRKKYHASGLPTVYDKVETDPSKGRMVLKNATFKQAVTSWWPLGGIHCMTKAWKSGVYHEARKSIWMKWSSNQASDPPETEMKPLTRSQENIDKY